jgi:hypothetical protein
MGEGLGVGQTTAAGVDIKENGATHRLAVPPVGEGTCIAIADCGEKLSVEVDEVAIRSATFLQ